MPNIFEDIKSGLFPKLVQIIVQKNQEGEAKELFKIDATISQAHSMASQATNFEVEDGSDLSDHVIRRGVRLSIQGVISDDPISLTEAVVTAIPGIVGGNFIGGIGGAVVAGVGAKVGSELLQTSGPRSLTYYTALRNVYEKRLPLTIISGLTTYENMIMERLNINQRASTSNGLHFTASFREIRIAISEVITIDVDSTAAKGVVKEKDNGTVPAEEATDKEAEKGSSVAVKLKAFFGF